MYELLCRLLPPAAAQIALILWYAVLIALVLMLIETVPGEFRYGQM